MRGAARVTRPVTGNDYPTSDGRPMAETEHHRTLMVDLIQALQDHFAGRRVFVSGNLLVFYERGNRNRHLSPDVFVVRGVDQEPMRDNYLIWEEGRGPEVVVELTSASTRAEDESTKRQLYQDVLRVREYFLFDPTGDWLSPRLQGWRLRGGVYRHVRPRDGRLHSQVLGLDLVQVGGDVRLWNPETGAILPTRAEAVRTAEERAAAAERELERLRRELEAARRRG